MLKSLLLSLVFGALASASTITYVGAPTGVSDGQFNVLPYQVTINGVTQLVDCYDTFDSLKAGDTWNANLLTVSQAAASGYFSGVSNALLGYEKVAWLSAQSYSDTATQIGLQHAIWNVFGSASVTAASSYYQGLVDTAAQGGFAGFDFSGFRFIEESNPGAVGSRKQALVFEGPRTATPEPGTVVLCAGAGLLLCALRRKHSRQV